MGIIEELLLEEEKRLFERQELIQKELKNFTIDKGSKEDYLDRIIKDLKKDNFQNILLFFNELEDFSDSYLFTMRFGYDMEFFNCIYCNSKKVKQLNGKTRRIKCYGCRKQFLPITKTIFEETKLDLKIWFMTFYLVIKYGKNISSHQLAKDLCITQKTAYFLLKKIKANC